MKIVKIKKLGKCSNGLQQGNGKIIHAMLAKNYAAGGHHDKAFCGVAPGRTSAGWEETDFDLNCDKCKRYIEKRQKARDVTPICRLGKRLSMEPASMGEVVHGIRSEYFARGCRSQALCGAKPGPSSAGWYSPEGREVTCHKCLNGMVKISNGD